MASVSEVLEEVVRGDRSRVDLLFSAVYADLSRMAAGLLRREPHTQTLEPTALVNEAYLKLVDQRQANWKTRSHFMAVSAGVMRRILVDRARRRARTKRGGGALRVTLTGAHARTLSVDRDFDVLAVDEILTRLEKADPRQARIVELRFYGGLTLEEAAEALGVSRRTIAYEWRIARAVIRAGLSGQSSSR